MSLLCCDFKAWTRLIPGCCPHQLLSESSYFRPRSQGPAPALPSPFSGAAPSHREQAPPRNPYSNVLAPPASSHLICAAGSVLGVQNGFFSTCEKACLSFSYFLGGCRGGSSHSGQLAGRGCSGEKQPPMIPGNVHAPGNSNAKTDSASASGLGASRHCPLPAYLSPALPESHPQGRLP